MSSAPDLVFDPNEVGPDGIVKCWISQAPRAADSSFDPAPGDTVTVLDEDGETMPGRVVRRDGNHVWVQVDLSA